MPYWMMFLAMSIMQIILAASYSEPPRVIAGIFMLIISGVVYYFEEELR